MPIDGVTGSDGASRVRDAQAVARPGGVVAALATRPRHEASGTVVPFRRPGSTPPETFTVDQRTDEPAASALHRQSTRGGQPANDGRGGPSSAFIAQALGQSEAEADSPLTASRALAGAQAYSRAATAATGPAPEPRVEIIVPSGVSASSSHTLDLAV